jgi:fatty acid desaturase
MKELHSFGWYAAKISPHLPKEAFKPVPSRLFGGLAYLLIALLGILVIAFFELQMWLNALIAVAVGLSFAGMCFLGHEILHGTVVRKPFWRDFLGGVAFSPIGIGPKLWRKWHNMTHHVHTQHEHNDPDTWSTAEFIAKRPLLAFFFRMPNFIRMMGYIIFLTFNFSLHSTRMFFVFLKEFKPKNQRLVLLELILPFAIWFGLLLLVGPIKWIFAYLIPVAIANFIMSSYIATNHNLNPQTEVNDPLANSLSVTVPKWVNILHFNFSYHTEHHLFPAMSSKYYPLVKNKILEFWPERYHQMPMHKAMVILLKTPRPYLKEDELVDMFNGEVYSVLGKGLNPQSIKSHKKLDLNQILITNKKQV